MDIEVSAKRVEVVDGYGADIRVKNDHLVLRNGDFGTRDRWERRIARGRCELERLVILSHDGTLTLDAIAWLSDLDVATIVLDRSGQLSWCSPPTVRHDAELRRTQALAGISDRGIDVAQWIVSEKLFAQSGLLENLPNRFPRHFGGDERCAALLASCKEILDVRERLPRSLTGLLMAEGRAAQIYWSVLQGQTIPWVRQSATRIPRHWLTIQPRTSGAEGLARNARDPFNAATNFVYALLEVECKIACAAVGADSDFGFLHVDVMNRTSFIYDLIEPLRSEADQVVLDFFFRWRERDSPIKNANFIELRNGVCRLAPSLARELVEFAMPTLRAPTLAWAEAFARKIRTPTVYSLKLESDKPVRFSRKVQTVKRTDCEYCGGPMRGEGDRFCGRSCFLKWSVEVNRPIEKAQARLAQLRSEGRDPSHGGAAAVKRGESNRAALARTWAWRRSEAGQQEADEKTWRQARRRRADGSGKESCEKPEEC